MELTGDHSKKYNVVLLRYLFIGITELPSKIRLKLQYELSDLINRKLSSNSNYELVFIFNNIKHSKMLIIFHYMYNPSIQLLYHILYNVIETSAVN